jgi:hypothetical protein
MTKKMTIGAYDVNGNLIVKGTTEEVAEKLNLATSTVRNAYIKGYKTRQKYIFKVLENPSPKRRLAPRSSKKQEITPEELIEVYIGGIKRNLDYARRSMDVIQETSNRMPADEAKKELEKLDKAAREYSQKIMNLKRKLEMITK